MTVAIEQTAAWNVVAERLEAFVAAWETGSEPALAPFLPAASPALRRLVLVELVKVDLDFRIRSGQPARVEDYLAAHPEIVDAAGPPVELVCEEYHLRKSRGEGIDLAELCGRFPGRAAELRRWLAGTERTITTSLGKLDADADHHVRPGHPATGRQRRRVGGQPETRARGGIPHGRDEDRARAITGRRPPHAFHHLCERAPGQELLVDQPHPRAIGGRLEPPLVIDPHDVWMIELGERAGFVAGGRR